MKKKYIFVSLQIKSGEYEFNSHTVQEISSKKHTKSFGNNYAKTFYSDFSAKEGDWFYFNCGEVAVRCTASEEITKNEYDVLNKFQYK
ncbi:MAG: hypothetical protein ACYDEC_12445 [Bacteroidia bacterium]